MSTNTRTIVIAAALALGAMACKAQVRATAEVSEPSLVLIDGDIWVVEHYNEPVFYTEGYYWRWYGGVWYRSTVHSGSWVRVTVVPARVQRIERPEIYVNYTAPAGAEKRTGPPDHAPAHGVRGTEPGHQEHGRGASDKPDKPEHAVKEDKPEKPAKEDKPEKAAKAEKADKPDKPEKAEKPDKPEKAEKAEKADKPDKPAPAKEERASDKGGGPSKSEDKGKKK